MTGISYNLSGKLDSSLVEVLQVVNQVATTLGIRFFMVGAMARDIVLEYWRRGRCSKPSILIFTFRLNPEIEISMADVPGHLGIGVSALARAIRKEEGGGKIWCF